MPKNSEIFSLTFFPLTASSSSYSRNIFRLKSFLINKGVKNGLKSQLPELPVGSKSFEESLVLGDCLLEGGQVVSFQILLHLSKGNFWRKKQDVKIAFLSRNIVERPTLAKFSLPPLASRSPILWSLSCVAWKLGFGGLEKQWSPMKSRS